MVATLYLIFAAASAFVEAVLYARRGAESFTLNEHVVMGVQRAAVVLIGPVALLLYHWTGSAWYVATEPLPALLLFPLVHDEAYNFTRLWLAWREHVDMPYPSGGSALDRIALRKAWDQYTYGYQSPTTTARNDFNGRQRTWLAILGLVAWATAAYFLL
ncbi:VirB3 family type IV secretion system protein [Hymenobacter negativus]|uniref:Uncharacterized protein n=1 Tax=Hymenobacter negativus TaxID=2795026 RepID=A0ABS3QD70_9BACT|nr:hypothetical protein [Hymenobacter negativus]MBO2009192.1 hypothetical protein [Hymenobacter negativus]